MANLDEEDFERLAQMWEPVAAAAAVEAAEGITEGSMHRALQRWGSNGGGELIRRLVAEEVAPVRAAVLGDPESLVPQPGLVQTMMDIRRDQEAHAGLVLETARELAEVKKSADRRHAVLISVISVVGTLGVPVITIVLTRIVGG